MLCNCDDPYESNFFKYFAMSFNSLGLKSLTATCYATSPVVYTQLDLFGDVGGLGEAALPKGRNGRARSPSAPQSRKIPYKIVINEVTDVNGDGRIDLADVEWLIKNKKNVLTKLKGDGDFRSPECVALLDEADVVVRQTFPGTDLARIDAGLNYIIHNSERFYGKWTTLPDGHAFDYTALGFSTYKGRITVRHAREDGAFVTFISFGKPYKGTYADASARHAAVWGKYYAASEVDVPAADRPDAVSMGSLAGYFPFPIFPKGHKEQTAAVDFFLAQGVKAGNMYEMGKKICPWYKERL